MLDEQVPIPCPVAARRRSVCPYTTAGCCRRLVMFSATSPYTYRIHRSSTCTAAYAKQERNAFSQRNKGSSAIAASEDQPDCKCCHFAAGSLATPTSLQASLSCAFKEAVIADSSGPAGHPAASSILLLGSLWGCNPAAGPPQRTPRRMRTICCIYASLLQPLAVVPFRLTQCWLCYCQQPSNTAQCQ